MNIFIFYSAKFKRFQQTIRKFQQFSQFLQNFSKFWTIYIIGLKCFLWFDYANYFKVSKFGTIHHSVLSVFAITPVTTLLTTPHTTSYKISLSVVLWSCFYKISHYLGYPSILLKLFSRNFSYIPFFYNFFFLNFKRGKRGNKHKHKNETIKQTTPWKCIRGSNGK